MTWKLELELGSYFLYCSRVFSIWSFDELKISSFAILLFDLLIWLFNLIIFC